MLKSILLNRSVLCVLGGMIIYFVSILGIKVRRLLGSWACLFDFKTSWEVDQSKNCPSTGLVLDRQWTGAGQVVYKLSSETLSSKGLQSPLNIYKHIKHNKLSFLRVAEYVKSRQKENYEIPIEKNGLPGKPKITGGKNMAVCLGQEVPPGATKVSKDRPQKISDSIIASVDTVIKFFLESNYSENLGVKFFSCYSVTGWNVGGKYPITNLVCCAHRWMLKSHQTVILMETHQGMNQVPMKRSAFQDPNLLRNILACRFQCVLNCRKQMYYERQDSNLKPSDPQSNAPCKLALFSDKTCFWL